MRKLALLGLLGTSLVVLGCGGSSGGGGTGGSAGGGGKGKGGSAGGKGGSAGATGSGGAGGSAAGGTSGSAGQNGPAGGAAGSGGASVPPQDGGSCFDDGGIDPSETPASGSFSGPAMSGVICGDGAIVYVEDNLRGTAPAALFGSPNIQAAGGIRFEIPANAVRGDLSIDVGMASPAAGTYGSTTTCGNLVLSAYLPVPPGLDCRPDGGAPGECASGCALQGPISGETCMPVQPEIDFIARTPMNCLGYTQTSQGSFKLVLTSVDLESTDAGANTVREYQVHGSLTASLIGQAADAGSSTVSLALTF
jgi:hypothetical protein